MLVLVLGIGLNVLRVPLHKMSWLPDPFQGEALHMFKMIGSNDIAGSQVWADVVHFAIIAPAPLVSCEHEKNQMDVLTASAMTWTVNHIQFYETIPLKKMTAHTSTMS